VLLDEVAIRLVTPNYLPFGIMCFGLLNDSKMHTVVCKTDPNTLCGMAAQSKASVFTLTIRARIESM